MFGLTRAHARSSVTRLAAAQTFTRRIILRRTALSAGVIAATLLPLSATNALAATQPTGVARFSLTVDGYEIASFSECVEALATPTLVLKRGTSRSQDLWVWHEAARNGVLGDRRDADVVWFDRRGEPTARYHLENAWPSDVSISGLKAGSSEVLMETVTLVADNVQRVSM
jgi:hypothetical protein